MHIGGLCHVPLALDSRRSNLTPHASCERESNGARLGVLCVDNITVLSYLHNTCVRVATASIATVGDNGNPNILLDGTFEAALSTFIAAVIAFPPVVSNPTGSGGASNLFQSQSITPVVVE